MPNSEVQQYLAQSLSSQGWCVLEHYFPATLIAELATEVLELHKNQHLRPAGIGRGQQLQQDRKIRQDAIHWLDGSSSAQQEYLRMMHALKATLNQQLYLGLHELEAHFAVYAPGAFYQKHLDSFQGAANRIVSVVSYLNTDWPETAGGELIIYAQDEEIIQVKPEAGKLVVFLSEEIPHAVHPAQLQRLSIAGWFRGHSHGL